MLTRTLASWMRTRTVAWSGKDLDKMKDFSIVLEDSLTTRKRTKTSLL
jgi:hypothetical protein